MTHNKHASLSLASCHAQCSVFLWIILATLALAAIPTARAQQTKGGDDIVVMDRFEVVTESERLPWQYLKTRSFEVLSSINDEPDSRMTKVIQDTQLVVDAFEKRSPFFQLDDELPIKIILIQNDRLERFIYSIDRERGEKIKQNQKGGTIKVSALEGGGRSVLVERKRSASGIRKTTREHRMAMMYIPDAHFSANPPYDHSLDEFLTMRLRSLYFAACRDKYRSESNYNLTYAFIYPLMLSLDAAERGYSSKTASSAVSPNTAWLALDRLDERVILRRHDQRREGEMYRVETKKVAGENFLPTPDISLREVIEQPGTFSISFNGKTPPKEVERHIKYKRQISDFSYYCVFGPSLEAKAGYMALLRYAKTQPVTEDVFIKCFSKTYEQFHREMYGYFSGQSKASKKNAMRWGLPVLTVSIKDEMAATKNLRFREATRSERTRILSEWFLACDAPDLAGESLLRARRNNPDLLRDPDAVATLALYEANHGDRKEALSLLEKAVTLNVDRPEVYRKLASMRLEDIRAAKGAEHRLAPEEIGAVLAPFDTIFRLRPPFRARARSQTDAVEDAFALPEYPYQTATWSQIAAIWDNADVKPPAATLTNLTVAALMHSDDFALLEKIVPFLRKNGAQSLADRVINNASKAVLTERERQQLEKLGVL